MAAVAAPLLGLGPGGWIAAGIITAGIILLAKKIKIKIFLLCMIIIIRVIQIIEGQMVQFIHIIIIPLCVNPERMLLKEP